MLYNYYLKGKLSCVTSPARHTTEWIKNTFTNGEFKDIVYISGNPYITSKKRKNLDGYHPRRYFKTVVDCWDYDFVYPSILWNTYKAIPKKHGRFILHFMQPHSPYVGCSRNQPSHKLLGRFANATVGRRNVNLLKRKLTKQDITKIENQDFIIDGYLNNLMYILESISGFVKESNGKKTIVTSDHGEMLFEDDLFGHGDNLPWRQELVDVPWLEVHT